MYTSSKIALKRLKPLKTCFTYAMVEYCMTYDIPTKIFSWMLKNLPDLLQKKFRLPLGAAVACSVTLQHDHRCVCSRAILWQALPTRSIPRSLPADINECSTGVSGCQQTCTNTEGSFLCGCNSGFNLNSNGRTCSGEPEKPSPLMNHLQNYV